MQASDTTDTVVIGAGNIGLAVAYYLAVRHGITRIVVLDPGDPMAMTSAQSGENYRNWWPHPVMTAYTDAAWIADAVRPAYAPNFTLTGYANPTLMAEPRTSSRGVL